MTPIAAARAGDTRWLALGGVIGPVAFVGSWAILGATTPGYSPVNGAISDLAAVDASSRAPMTAGFVVFGLGLDRVRVRVARRARRPGVGRRDRNRRLHDRRRGHAARRLGRRRRARDVRRPRLRNTRRAPAARRASAGATRPRALLTRVDSRRLRRGVQSGGQHVRSRPRLVATPRAHHRRRLDRGRGGDHRRAKGSEARRRARSRTPVVFRSRAPDEGSAVKTLPAVRHRRARSPARSALSPR